MAQLILIRHGQASFDKANYDQLSSLGTTQSHLLGEALKTLSDTPDILEMGTLNRHRQTAENCLGMYGSDRMPDRNDAWNEYDHMELIARHRPDLDSFEALTAYAAEGEAPMARIQGLLNAAIADWQANKHAYTQSWTAFKSGVAQSIRTLGEKLPKGGTAWVFTSGGPISSAVMEALTLSDASFMDLQGKLINASITRLWVKGERVQLHSYNEHGHLAAQPDWITYR